jgi:integrase/recombinase XerD
MGVNVPIPMKDPADYLDYEECERFIDAAQNMKDRIILGLLWKCGLRAFEVGYLRKKSIVEDDECIIVFGKGKRRQRVPVTPDLMGWMKTFTAGFEPEDYLFPTKAECKHLTRFAVFRLVKKYSKITGIEVTKANRPMHPHAFRHSLAIFLVKMGVPLPKVQMILRHSSLVPTTYYLQFSKEELAEDYLQAWEKAKQQKVVEDNV